MSSKLEKLKQLKEEINLTVNGIDNFPLNDRSLIISNHNCLMDVFYVSASLPIDIVSIISPRLIYKKDNQRQNIINKYLNAMPIEAHGGKKYSDICLKYATKLLCSGISLNIFPEGAYIDDLKNVYRGRTGASRILYSCKDKNITPYLVPIAIDIKSNNLDLNNYYPTDDEITVSILKPIDYEEEYYNYKNSDTFDEKNKFLHLPIDKSLIQIANTLNRQYINQYIELYKKGNIIFQNGETVPVIEAQNDDYYNKYIDELNNRFKILKKI